MRSQEYLETHVLEIAKKFVSGDTEIANDVMKVSIKFGFDDAFIVHEVFKAIERGDVQ